ncbi:phage tail fiber protein [Escherichia coli]|nr:phage tail fiber protein [Escherichia coli]
MLNALAGKQPLDNTLTNLSGKDVAGLLAYLFFLGIAPAIGVPFFWPSAAMPDTVIESWSSMVQPMVSVSVMSDAVQSDPSNPAPQVLSVNFEHISNSAWRVATSDISQQYRFSYISIGR